ncbi:uncharacterized protein CIMG_12998 [Coccidioides immitis RS]|uniref:Uncharacterized protein n=1 Tax=Coccidioides immitis (strain RS) TaxID=246410 RepID=A0A0E1RVP2_COCIM|nr:uncharacterized protein CIMG_12998 [Coccidioides immitis RS]EAS30385.2 hypothetical protein CIMG_12998 [Coccidioides immitis RS]
MIMTEANGPTLQLQQMIEAMMNMGIIQAMTEKQCCKQGKPLGLLNRDNPSQVQFWSPTKVLKACEHLDEIEAKKADKIAQTQQAKL